MLSLNLPLHIADAPASAEPYAAPRRAAIWAPVVVAGKEARDSVQDTDWTDAMLALRDRQDKAAFAALFRHFAPRVKAFLMKGGASAAQAEDHAQEVMATLWHKAHLYDPTRASVATWVFTIARNRRIDAIRRARRPEPEDLPWGPEPEPDQADALVLAQESNRLTEALAQLPPKQRELVERAYWGDLTHSELAVETGLPLGTIKSRIRLALDRLRHELR
ncbi:RNA polymerase subunit sigma [Rhodobacter veldkampii DSM 11550]|uniref:RNA polymerase subunit sigma n=2 Tax=Phaeovulum veldkampii TaxID=33049 RepID=A0A2T4JLK2_9RHOB|nr:RNA polymerase subunit sigma [Phaeovulum veldkampii DSM 11550]NCU19739.1 sigma-70 family RNA polymerase sigma factor [Candidatus Falkowbacteria bacterium]PTE18789.1 RNA polymerase subunit sigma [Phaeovulum veldkampii DSM 11550]